MKLTWKVSHCAEARAYNEHGRLVGIVGRDAFRLHGDWSAHLAWEIPHSYLGTWDSEERAKAAVERAAGRLLDGREHLALPGVQR